MTAPRQGTAPRLSVVIPAFNEAGRITPYLSAITQHLNRQGAPYEILVVDDGSQDETARVVDRFRSSAPAVRLLGLKTNAGKGAAVRAGVQDVHGDLLLIADADGATPITELDRLEAAIAQGADIAIGSRFLGSRDPRCTVRARWHRSLLGSLFNRVIQRLGIRGIADTQCGFKLFRRAVARDLFSVARINGYGFDLEILYVAQRRGYRIAEVPVNWADQPGSKVRVVRDGLTMLGEMVRIRRNDARGLYDPAPRSPGTGPFSSPAPGGS